MGRFERAVSVAGALDATGGGADIFFELGMMCSTGGSMPADYVSAHKWFNLAAMRGCKEAIRLRGEMAELMSARPTFPGVRRRPKIWLIQGSF